MKITLWRSMAIASIGLTPIGLATNANAAPQDQNDDNQHWTENSPYYEQDAWYDITEWFDGNDFRRTDETWAGNDETDFNADYSYDYDWDDQWDDTYGYDDRYDYDDWFYDYYDYDNDYVYYGDLSDDLTYRSSTIYSDYDDDGFYDAVLTSHDWDGDGFYEDVDYYTLNSAADRSSDQSSRDSQQARSSRQQRVSGQVKNVKKASVRDAKHLVARIQTDNGQQAICDLGPAKNLQDANIEQGDNITCAGPASKVGDKRVVMAEWVKVGQNGEKQQVQRDAATIKGQVADTRKAKVHGAQHLMVILKTDADKKFLCDLGPAQQLDANINQGDQLKVSGVPAKAGDRKIVLAQSATINGQKTDITRDSRPQARSQQSQTASSDTRGDRQRQQSTARIQGEVQSTRQIKVRGADRQVAMVNDRNGRRVLIDLGAADAAQLDLRQGDRITAAGIATKNRDGSPVLLARQVTHNGQTTKIDNRQQRSSLTNANEVSGEVQKLQTVRVNDSQRRLATIKTNDGRTRVVDLGSPDQAAARVSRGDTITAEGVPVKVKDSTILVAFEVSPQDGRSIKVDRGVNTSGQSSRR